MSVKIHNEINHQLSRTWTPFTTTITAVTTNPTLPKAGSYKIQSYYLKFGKILYVFMIYSQSALGVTGSGIYLFNIPPGFTINTTIAPVYNQTTATSATPRYFSALGSWFQCASNTSPSLSNIPISMGCAAVYDATHYLAVNTYSWAYLVGETPSQTPGLGDMTYLTYSAMLSIPIV
jgi:hypothetical protein